MNSNVEKIKFSNKNRIPYNIDKNQTNKEKHSKSDTSKLTDKNEKNFQIECNAITGCRIVTDIDSTKKPVRRGFGGRSQNGGISKIRMGGCSSCGG